MFHVWWVSVSFLALDGLQKGTRERGKKEVERNGGCDHQPCCHDEALKTIGRGNTIAAPDIPAEVIRWSRQILFKCRSMSRPK